MIEIVKVQRSFNKPTMYLIYDQRQSRTRQYPDYSIPFGARSAMGVEMKAFFEAEWNPVKEWILLSRTKDEDW